LLRLPPFDSTEEAFVSKWIPALGVVTLVAVGCMAETHEAGSVSVGLAEAGPWDVPLATRRIADPQYVAYDGAGPWIGSAGCGPGLLSGTAALGAYLDRAFPQVRGIGGYSCRRNTGDTSRTSVHGTGRALDVFIPLDGGAADNGLGDEVANWLIEHAEEIGVQYVIWDRWQWISAASPGSHDRDYGGPHAHHDHIHVELTERAADRRTAWFSGPMAPPAAAPTVPPTCDPGTTYSPHFCDDDGHWAEASVRYLHSHRLTSGCGEINGKPLFCPEASALRAQVLTILGKASEMPLAGHPDAFDDDDGHWSEPYNDAAAAFGITNGCAARRVCPQDDATRSQIAAFLSRLYGLPPATRDHFDDDEGSPFENAHNRLAEAGITSGCGTRRFCGDEVATRAMLAVFVHRVHSRGHRPIWAPDDTVDAGPDVDPAEREEPTPPPPGSEPDSEDPTAPSADPATEPAADPVDDPGVPDPFGGPSTASSGALYGGCSAASGPSGIGATSSLLFALWLLRRRFASR
jgi:hypothetical protein